MSLAEIRPSNCPVCLQLFDSMTRLPIVYSCGHSICKMCDEYVPNIYIIDVNAGYTMDPYKCQVCREQTQTKSLNTGLIETLHVLEDSLESIGELDIFETIYECSNCQKKTLKKNMHSCKTCVIDQSSLDLPAIAEDVRKLGEVSVCSNCIIPLHAYKGHTIVAMFSTLSELNFALGIQKNKQILEEFEQSCSFMDETFACIKALSIKVPKYYNLLADIAQQKKIIEQQNEVFEKMEEFIDECISINHEAEHHIIFLTYFRQGYKHVLTEMAKKSESTEQQNTLFELQRGYLTGEGVVIKEIADELQRQKNKLQESITKIEEWGTVQMDNFVEEIQI